MYLPLTIQAFAIFSLVSGDSLLTGLPPITLPLTKPFSTFRTENQPMTDPLLETLTNALAINFKPLLPMCTSLMTWLLPTSRANSRLLSLFTLTTLQPLSLLLVLGHQLFLLTLSLCSSDRLVLSPAFHWKGSFSPLGAPAQVSASWPFCLK